MNAARALLATLADAGIDTLFANPGTSEMHLVAALDSVPQVRPVLGLFEGVVTGAADGYARMQRRPAATLLHLGPGLANGLANLHNARRAATPLLNIVGDHATAHVGLNAPLTADIEALARPMSDWVGASPDAAGLPRAGALALARARDANGGVATLRVPADHAWGDAEPVRHAPPSRPRVPVDADALHAAVTALRGGGEHTALLLGGPALDEASLTMAGRVAATTGCRLLLETFPPRLRRGAGVVMPRRLAYRVDAARAQLDGTRHLLLLGAADPASLFAYPGQPGRMAPADASRIDLGGRDAAAHQTLEALVDALGCAREPTGTASALRPPAPSGALTADAVAASVAHLLPPEAIVVDEATTAGAALYKATAGAPPHDWLALTGGSIGQGLPLAVGAQLAGPDRPVLCVHGDGGAMYTLQALWTLARERLPVVVVIVSNRRYAILDMELDALGGGGYPCGRALFDLSRPALDWVQLARGHGVAAVRADDADGFHAALARALSAGEPTLIEAVTARG